MSKKTYTGAQIIVDYLIKENVPYVIALCGHGNVGLLDALYERKDEIKTISVRHEQAAGHIADAYFRVAHRPLATLTSCGPGSANILMATQAAFLDSSAFLAITGNVATSQFNRGPFQESGRHYQADFPSVIRHSVKHSYQTTRADMVPLAVRQAFKMMLTGRTGPVNLDVPFDVFMETAEAEVPEPSEWREGITSRAQGDPEAVRQALDMLLAAERPMIFAGHGVVLAEGYKALVELAEYLGIPVANTPNGAGAIDSRHELCLGPMGRNGTYQANQAGRNCDVLLALGTRFDDRMTSAWIDGFSFSIPPTSVIQVDIDPDELARNYPVKLGILGDAGAVLNQLLALIKAGGVPRQRREGWLNQIKEWRKIWGEYCLPLYKSDAVPIRPERVISDVREVMPEDGILVADVGVHHNWIVQHWKVYKPQTLLNSWGFAGMGFGVCGVLGAKLAAPDKTCVTICGDGGFMMAPHALCTAVEYDLPAVWVIWNNYSYAAIRDFQVFTFGGRELATKFEIEKTGMPYNPDFAAMAKACGAGGIRVEKPEDIKPAVARAISANKPFVVDIVVDSEIRPVGTGGWVLPPLPPIRPTFGR